MADPFAQCVQSPEATLGGSTGQFTRQVCVSPPHLHLAQHLTPKMLPDNCTLLTCHGDVNCGFRFLLTGLQNY